MKTRLLIIIGILVALGFWISFVAWETYHSQPIESIDESTYLSSDEQLQRVLDHCEGQRKLATGEIPKINADGSFNISDAIGLSFQNGTHYIDNNTCVWKLALTEEQLHDQIDIVFGGVDWPVYPGGGLTPPENFTLTTIYEDNSFGLPHLDLEAMLDDKIFVDRCESNNGTWNYSYHDCEGIFETCQDVGGIQISRNITTPCTGICLDRTVYRLSCVFEYEN